MSLLEERNYYKPFQYPWAFEYYKAQQHMHWVPDEVNLADDLRDYRDRLPESQQRLLAQLFRFFTQADVDVCKGYAEHYLPRFRQPEVRMMLSAFAAMESVPSMAASASRSIMSSTSGSSRRCSIRRTCRNTVDAAQPDSSATARRGRPSKACAT